jgi:NAD-dependent dihydropyrimidine dehydrogenase PreA subunit
VCSSDLDGCGLCVPNCAEGAIRIVDGKARLVAENLCDGLGACLGHCPKGAISIEERSDRYFAQKEVEAEQKFVCPSAAMRRPKGAGQWPIQLALLPESGPIWHEADLLLAADCAAFAMKEFQNQLLPGKTLAVACPKLDDAQFYIDKLSRIFARNDIKSIAIARMEVPCCGGLERLISQALSQAGKAIPVSVVIIGTDGSVNQPTPKA